jgi:quinol monooxygenase YgiN
MSIGYGFHATMTALPGKGDELVDLLLRAPALPHKDCLVFLVGRSASDPDVVHVTEGWSSEQAHREFFATAPARETVARTQALLAGEAGWDDQIPLGGKAFRS